MMKPLENSKTLSNIKRGFAWGYEEMLERMLCGCDDKTIREALQGSLKKKGMTTAWIFDIPQQITETSGPYV